MLGFIINSSWRVIMRTSRVISVIFSSYSPTWMWTPVSCRAGQVSLGHGNQRDLCGSEEVDRRLSRLTPFPPPTITPHPPVLPPSPQISREAVRGSGRAADRETGEAPSLVNKGRHCAHRCIVSFEYAPEMGNKKTAGSGNEVDNGGERKKERGRRNEQRKRGGNGSCPAARGDGVTGSMPKS